MNKNHDKKTGKFTSGKSGGSSSSSNSSSRPQTFQIDLNKMNKTRLPKELKKKGLPWEKAKAWDNSAVVGKWVDITPDILKNPINFSLQNNKAIVQEGNSKDMIFSFDFIVSHISNYFSLNIGDLVFTGTPAGVGECVVGDMLEGYLEKEKMFEVEIK